MLLFLFFPFIPPFLLALTCFPSLLSYQIPLGTGWNVSVNSLRMSWALQARRRFGIVAQPFGCQTDARTAWEKARTGKLSWFHVTFCLKEQPQAHLRGHPKQGSAPDQTGWSLVPALPTGCAMRWCAAEAAEKECTGRYQDCWKALCISS